MRKDDSEADDGKQVAKILRALLLAEIDNMTQREQIKLLNRAGFGQSEIARVLGSTPKAISVRLAELRRHDSKPRRKHV